MVSPVLGSIYRSTSRPIRGPLAIGWYRWLGLFPPRFRLSPPAIRRYRPREKEEEGEEKEEPGNLVPLTFDISIHRRLLLPLVGPMSPQRCWRLLLIRTGRRSPGD
ncbi:hypothetical protein BHM03_00049200, partial [Ensete ventricosum]